MTLYLDDQDVRAVLSAADLDTALRSGLRAISSGDAVAPPRVSAVGPRGLVGAMPGYVPGLGMAAKLVTVFPGNHALGLPSHQGVVITFDPETGVMTGLLDAAAITTIRTAQTAAIAVDVLARAESATLAIVGAGALGAEHLSALSRTRAWTDIRIASRTRSKAEVVALGDPRARVLNTFEEAVRGADVICCCTDAAEPIIDAAWVSTGAHVSSVGRRNELPLGVIQFAPRQPVFVEWRGAATFPPPAGAEELQHLAGTADRDLVELGEVLLGRRPGRESSAQVTVYKSTGHAVEDLAAASVALDAAIAMGRGRILPSAQTTDHPKE
jgi:ornithine cyclodeaminase/alanine dehydrogenase-like protein (mu-crystallin family)